MSKAEQSYTTVSAFLIKGVIKIDSAKEIDILDHAIMLSYSITQADKANQWRYFPELFRAKDMTEQTSLEFHSELKRLALEAIDHAITYVKTGRFLEAKLTEVTGKKYIKELGRLQQILEENQNQ